MANGFKSVAGHPKKIIFLTCDAFGILPAISKLFLIRQCIILLVDIQQKLQALKEV